MALHRNMQEKLTVFRVSMKNDHVGISCSLKPSTAPWYYSANPQTHTRPPGT